HAVGLGFHYDPQLVEIDAVMAAETFIFRGKNSEREDRRHAIDRHRHALDSCTLDPPPQHERGDRIDHAVERSKGIREDQQDGDSYKQHPDYLPQPSLQRCPWQRSAHLLIRRPRFIHGSRGWRTVRYTGAVIAFFAWADANWKKPECVEN